VSIIEQAARRLEELRRSGIEVSAEALQRPPVAAPAPSVPAAAMERMVAAPVPTAPAPDRAPAVTAVHAPAPVAPAEPAAASRGVEVDLQRLAAMGYLTPQAPRSQMANELRIIKRPVLHHVQSKGGPRANLVMVTSSMPGEGKTFTAVNLAISMAMELDTTVLLVDADVARPSVLTRLGLAPAPGLLDVLTDPSLKLSDVLLRTNIDKLSILPAGSPQERATELLASESMNRLLDDMAHRYPDRVLVFDAPPLLQSTESRVLATHMGQVLVVVEAENTPVAQVQQALGMLESCPVVLPVLNKAARSDVDGYYGY
jgi:receptor protein-tyrosine kinase